MLRPYVCWYGERILPAAEQPAEAVRRELYEETGLELKELKMFRVRTVGRHVEILFHAEAVGTAAVKSLEINAVGWFKTDALPKELSRLQKSQVAEVISQRV